ncbi:MAG: sigma-70 family RNA polymerase sigma factor [Steroidobacteraceae bacterium]
MPNGPLLLNWRQRWNRNLVQFLRGRARSSVDVHDLAQETYLRLLRARDLGEVRNPLAYMLQVASHVAMEWYGGQPRSESLSTQDVDTFVDERLPEIEIDAGMLEQRIEATLAAASPMMRAVFVLKVRDQRTTEQIATDLRITVRQVRRHLARGYELLRMAIED